MLKNYFTLYLTCLKVYLSTSTNPASFARLLSLIKLCGVYGGTKCKKSNYFEVISPLEEFLKIAIFSFLFISIKFDNKTILLFFS